MNKTQKIVATTVIALGAASIAIPANASSADWNAIARCESSGNWHDTAGMFEGGLQFLNSTWLSYGGGKYAQHAYNATPSQQVAIAEKVLNSQGPGAWPNCFVSGNSSPSDSTGSRSAEQRSSVEKAPVKTYKAPEKVQSAPKNDVHTTFTYRVKEGDTLSFIGWYFNVDWHKIYKTNKKVIGNNPNLIFPGEVLTITVNY